MYLLSKKNEQTVELPKLYRITPLKTNHEEPILYGFLVSKRMKSPDPKYQESKG